MMLANFSFSLVFIISRPSFSLLCIFLSSEFPDLGFFCDCAGDNYVINTQVDKIFTG